MADTQVAAPSETEVLPVIHHGHAELVAQPLDGAIGAAVVDQHDVDGGVDRRQRGIDGSLEPGLGPVGDDDGRDLRGAHRRAG
jgi:hypothetical protein